MALDDSTPTPEAQPGSVPVLMAEVRYAVVFAEMNEVFYSRVHKLLLFITTLCGLLSATGFVALATKVSSDGTMLWWALGLAAVSAIAQAMRSAYKFNEREKAFAGAKRDFQVLEGKGWAMNQGNLQREIARLRAKAPAGGKWLASAAYNKACEELGHPEYHVDVPVHARILGGALAY